MNEVPHGVTKSIDSILASKLLTELVLRRQNNLCPHFNKTAATAKLVFTICECYTSMLHRGLHPE
jgi:hypothetical protein